LSTNVLEWSFRLQCVTRARWHLLHIIIIYIYYRLSLIRRWLARIGNNNSFDTRSGEEPTATNVRRHGTFSTSDLNSYQDLWNTRIDREREPKLKKKYEKINLTTHVVTRRYYYYYYYCFTLTAIEHIHLINADKCTYNVS